MAAQFSYFTTSDDLREIVKQVDANTQFQYIEYKNFSESEYPNARMYDSLLEYPHLGYARSAQCRGDMFLVLNRTQALCPKIIPTDNCCISGTEYAIYCLGTRWTSIRKLVAER